jgi:hypothetical protein
MLKRNVLVEKIAQEAAMANDKQYPEIFLDARLYNMGICPILHRHRITTGESPDTLTGALGALARAIDNQCMTMGAAIYGPRTVVLYNRDDPNELVGRICVRENTHGTLTVVGVIDDEWEKKYLEMMNSCFTLATQVMVNVYRVSARGITSKALPLTEDSVPTFKAEHYPYLDQSPEDLMAAFMGSTSNVLFIIGPPGTGKTSYIKGLTMAAARQGVENVSLYQDAAVLEHPGVSTKLAEDMQDDEVGLLIMEDADAFVRTRTEGNVLMSTLLNGADGLVSTRAKIIISTNLESTSKVDSALLRPGRCYGILKFRPLEGEEVTRVRTHMGLPPVDLTTATLAEATSTSMDLNHRVKGFGYMGH